MAKHKLQIIGFDGVNLWRLYFVEIQDDKDVFYGSSQKSLFAFSRHGDGNVTVKIGKSKQFLSEIDGKKIDRPPLAELKKPESMTFAIREKEEISEKDYKRWMGKQYHAVFIVDLRQIQHAPNLIFSIVPTSYMEIDKIINPQCSCAFFYTSSSPRIMLQFVDFDLEKHKATKAKIAPTA